MRRFCYAAYMSQSVTKTDTIMPSATASDDEVRRWHALPRDEQLRRMRRTLIEARDSGISSKSMADIKAAAHRQLAAAKHG